MNGGWVQDQDIVTAAGGNLARRDLVSVDGILHARPQRPLLTSRDRGWRGVTLDVHGTYLGCAEGYAGLDHHMINYCMAGSGRLIQRRAGGVHDGVISAGMSFIMPAGYDSAWEGDAARSARLRVPTTLVEEAAGEVGQRPTAGVEIRNMFEGRDPFIERMAIIFAAELENSAHPTQALIIDSVSAAIAAHLLRRYNAFETVEAVRQPALGRAELARLVSFIEDNIERPIGLAELAALVNVSRFHFARLFKRSTGMTAIGFVEQRRIRRAQMLIADTDFPLAQIALMAGFADQSHFTRRFHRHVGCTPAVFAREQGRRRHARAQA